MPELRRIASTSHAVTNDLIFEYDGANCQCIAGFSDTFDVLSSRSCITTAVKPK